MDKRIFIVFAFFVFLLSLFVSGVDDSQDGLQYLAVARNIYYEHEPTAPVYEYGTEGGWKNIHMSTYVGRNGKTYTLTGLGYSLAKIPAVVITDFFYRIYKVSPAVHFPLENDWLIFLTTSFTNVFFAAFLAVILYLFLIEIGLKYKTAILITFVSIFTTNLWALSKHLTAHMMFTSFLFATFYFLKKFSVNAKKIFLYLAGATFGVTMITYNNSFLLAIPAILVYYILLTKPKLQLKSLKTTLVHLLIFILGTLPFIIVYLWFENLRAPQDAVLSSPSFLMNYAKNKLISVPLTVLFEGLWGQLFSPGRSIFIYSPLLLLPILFWQTIKKRIFPETMALLLLSITYIAFYASLYSVGSEGNGITSLWAGESSWGPRYLSSLIPLGMLIVGHIYQRMTRKEKLLIFLPLALAGLYVEILGISMPNQIKHHYLDHIFFINKTEYNVFTYSNLLPRYSPIIMQTKNLFRLTKNFKRTTVPGKYNVKMYDGIDFAFDVGPERWRTIANKGYISFDDDPVNKIKEIQFGIINHPISNTVEPLLIRFEINGKVLESKPTLIKITERKIIQLDLSGVELKDKQNILAITATYQNKNILKENKQLPAIINMTIDGFPVDKELIRVPYVSDFGPKMTGIPYLNWGGENIDLWNLWNIHTQVYERTFDFWWLRPVYYWDIPKKPFLSLFIVNLLGVILFGKMMFKYLTRQ